MLCHIKSRVKDQRQKKLEQIGQQTLDSMMKVPQAKDFSRENVLKSVADFVVCDDQVSWLGSLIP